MTRKRRGLSMTSILVLALVGTITAIVLGAMAVFLQTYQRSLIRSVQTSARQSVAQVGKTVEDYLDDVNSLMELLERKLEDPRQDRDDFFAAFLQIRPDVVAVTTYDAAGGLVDCRSRGAKRTEIYQNLSFDPDKMDDYADGYVSTPHVASIFQGYYPWVVTLVAPLDAPGREEWIALDISFSSISAYLNDVGIGQHGYCFLMDQSGNIIYHPQQQLIYSDLKRENTSLIAGLPDGSNESGSMIYTLTSLENSHWRVVGVSFVEELITESVQEVSRILAASGIGILLAAVIISFVLFRTLSRPMHGLTAAMRQFEQDADNFTYVPVGGAREVRVLSDSFGQMVVQIQRLMEQVRAEEVNLRKTELRALQAQINPHFLFNTLNTIASLCRTDPMKARDVLRAFSMFYRRTLESSEKTLIPLEQELEQTRRYLTIEKARFGESRIVESEHVEPGCEALPVPSFLVQPIVENAVRHAMRDTGPLNIDIHVAADGDDILIAVADDGLGMTQEVADRLLEKPATMGASGQKGTGMALRNVAERIERFFDAGSGVEVVSKPGEGTCVTLKLVGARLNLARKNQTASA